MRAHLTRWALPLTVAALAAATLPATVAHASSAITGVKVTKVTHTSFTVRLDSQGSGWKYRVYASTDKTDVFYSGVHSAPYHSALRGKPRVTVANLPYRAKPYWWRVQASKNGHFRTGPIESIGLRPSAPTGLTVSTVAGSGLSLTWGGGASNGYQVQQSTDPTFSTGVTKYTTRGLGQQFTPYGLATGTPYSFRVRSSNLGTNSHWSTVQTSVAAARTQTARVGDFNIHDLSKTGNTLPSWQDRRDAVVASIGQGHPDVLAIAEGGASVDGSRCGKRQVDDLVSHLGGSWTLADTEAAPCTQAGWVRSGVYVIYDASTYRAVGDHGTWKISDPSAAKRWWAAYQVLENRASGARMLFVSTHLIVGNKDALDKERAAQTRRLLADVAGLKLGLPVVYAGDFNSHERRPYDGPGDTMRQAGVADAWFVAQHRVNAKYNSANNYQRTPPHQGVSIDHVYGSPGVALRTWQLVMKLKDGQYVGMIPSDHNMLVSDISYPY